MNKRLTDSYTTVLPIPKSKECEFDFVANGKSAEAFLGPGLAVKASRHKWKAGQMVHRIIRKPGEKDLITRERYTVLNGSNGPWVMIDLSHGGKPLAAEFHERWLKSAATV